MLARLGRWVSRWRRHVLAAWTLTALAGGIFGGSVFDQAEPADNLRPGVESTLAKQRLAEVSPEGDTVVAIIAGREFTTTSLVDSASRVLYDIRGINGVVDVSDAYTSGNNSFIGPANQSSMVVVELQPGLSDDEALAVADQVKAALHRIDAPQVLVGGELLAKRTFADQAIQDAAFGESIALVVLCVVLVVLLGGLAVGMMPLAVALSAVAATLLVLTGLAGLVPISEYTVNVVTLLGLGLAVDYSLLILARFREERAIGPAAPVEDLLARTLSTSGRGVVISGLAVATALTGLFLFADPILAEMALGGIFAVCLATVAGLTLTPALIAIGHRRIPASGARLRLRQNRSAVGPHVTPTRGVPDGVLARLAVLSQRRPVVVALLGFAALAVLSTPLWSINLANSDVRSLPASSEERRAHDLITAEFGSKADAPMTVLIEASPAQPAVQQLLDQLDKLSGVDEVYERDYAQDTVTVADLQLTSPASGEALVREIRALQADVPFLVAGPAAELVDAKDSAADRLPVVVLIVAAATGLLLFALTGSLIVPLKALCLNMLTLAATLGVLVAVFQWGWGASLLGFEPWGALDLTTPLLLFVFVFGLSMDYEVFLLARIKEEWDRLAGRDREASDRAVLAGITATGRVVTIAAIAIGVVFLGFALGELAAVKEIGIGMTVAVVIDVTVIRGLLLPAVMSLLGRHNWWPAGPARILRKT